jgi:hypothetical protein
VNTRMICLAGLLAILTFVPGLAAQSKDGIVRGTVQDERKNLIPGVQATLTNTETKATHKIKTTESGEYRFDVPAGTYEFSAELPGFKTVKVSKITVKENESVRMDTLTMSTLSMSSDRVPIQRGVIPIPLAPKVEPPSNRL